MPIIETAYAQNPSLDQQCEQKFSIKGAKFASTNTTLDQVFCQCPVPAELKNAVASQNISCMQFADTVGTQCAVLTNPSGQNWLASEQKCGCTYGQTDDGLACIANTQGDMGISCTPEQMIYGGCHINVNKVLGIKGGVVDNSPTTVIQDALLAGTSFVGVVITLGLIYTGFNMVQGGFSSSDATGKFKDAIKNILIGLILIMGSYVFIRALQYIAKGV